MSSVQPLRTNRNEFRGVALLGAGYFVQINSAGRSHGGTATIELLNPRTGQPCSLEEWRALVPAPVPVPDAQLGSGPASRAQHFWCESVTPVIEVGYLGAWQAASETHGVRLGLKVWGKGSFGPAAQACLASGTPSMFENSAVIELV